MLIRPAVVASLLLLPALASCGSGDDEPAGQASEDATCNYVEDPAGAAKDAELPKGEPTVTGTQKLVISTSQGDIPVTLDADAAPCTVNSFVSLAEQGYYDDTTCHRFINDFMIQCGDPSATGSGGPGYTIPDELTGDETYAFGTVAMARTTQPNSGGSQFFLMVADYPLDKDYTVFGQVDPAGLKVLEKINKGTNGPDGVAPSPAVDITSVK